MKNITHPLLVAVTFLLLIISGCSSPVVYDINPVENKAEIKRRQCILVYMSADNNLESAGIEDVLEMEASCLNTDEVTVLILMDRSVAHDTSNDNWSGTRLLKLVTNSSENKICSERIECEPLGLKVDVDVELDMSSPYILSNAMDFMIKQYPSEKYGLIMWGHGTGWRSDGETDSEVNQKGFAFDDSSKTYMTLKQLGEGIAKGIGDTKLSFIGFDTCFGSELEVLYELKDCSDFLVGSEGLVMSKGWNYTQLFNDFQKEKNKSALQFCENVVQNFKNEYSHSSGASISYMKMTEINQYFKTFDDFMGKAALYMSTAQKRDQIMQIIYSGVDCKTRRYSYGTENNDIYLDVESVVANLKEFFDSQGFEINTEYQNFLLIKNKAVINAWNVADGEMSGGPGVYFSTITAGGLLSSTPPPSYIRGNTSSQISFVTDSLGYVPSVNHGTSFLNKLFYTTF